MSSFWINGVGHSHPGNIITNEFLGDLEIGTDNQWIMERVGIRERRTILPIDHLFLTKNRVREENTKYIRVETPKLVEEAFELALSRSSLKRDDIELVVAGGCTPTSLIPCDAATYANVLGIAAPCIDFNSACSSFTAGLHFLKQMSGYKNVMLINCEVPTIHN